MNINYGENLDYLWLVFNLQGAAAIALIAVGLSAFLSLVTVSHFFLSLSLLALAGRGHKPSRHQESGRASTLPDHQPLRHGHDDLHALLLVHLPLLPPVQALSRGGSHLVPARGRDRLRDLLHLLDDLRHYTVCQEDDRKCFVKEEQ